MQLELAVQKLSGEVEGVEEVMFWGKITGMQADYYVALGIHYQDQYEFPDKKFFWCTSTNFEFQEFPELNKQHRDFIEACADFFAGVPDKILVEVEKKEGDGGEEGAEEALEEKNQDELATESESEEEEKIVPRNLLELNRLHFLVLAIEHDCNAVPVYSFKLNPSHEIRRNEAFKGNLETQIFRLNFKERTLFELISTFQKS